MIETTNSFEPNEYLHVTKDEVEIIDTLVDNNLMFTDFSRNRVLCFMRDEDLCLVMYFALDYDRGFVMYVVRDFSTHVRTMMWLTTIFKQLVSEGYNEDMMLDAIHQVQNMIGMAPTFRAVFNKSYAEEDEYEYY